MAEILSRHTDPTPVKCGDCGWIGRVMDCKHGYAPLVLAQDVEPMDFCPKCDSNNLNPIEKEFRCLADFTFQAENIDDAFTKLSEHFKNIRDGKDSHLIALGEIRIGVPGSKALQGGDFDISRPLRTRGADSPP